MANIVQIEITEKDGVLLTSSRDIAKEFHKRHDTVLRAIDKLECTDKFAQHNFAVGSYLDANNQPRREFAVTENGFMFLAMGFSGKKAAEAKERFILAFQAMRNQITAEQHQVKPMTQAEIIHQQSGVLVNHERDIREIKQEIKVLKAQNETETNYFAIAGYARFVGINIDDATANKAGRLASKICKERSITKGTTKHPRYGFIGTYPETIISEVFEMMEGAA